MSMALLVIIGTVAVFAVIIIAAIEVKRVDKNKPSLVSKQDVEDSENK